MRLTYLNGTSADDPFFDLSEEDQYREMATHLNLNPNDSTSWPKDTLARLIGRRKVSGEKVCNDEIRKMMSA